MTEKNQGLRSLLKKPFVYDFFQFLIGANNARRRYVNECVRPETDSVLLDIGCGTGSILNFLPPSIQYYGFDSSQNYINQAKREFSNKGVFFCKNINDVDLLHSFPKFTLVIASGILHHLDDFEALKLLNIASRAMNPKGRLITLDGCYIQNQSTIARFVLKKDRGQNIRTRKEYETLARKIFKNVKTTLFHDMLRIPYTHLVMECSQTS